MDRTEAPRHVALSAADFLARVEPRRAEALAWLEERGVTTGAGCPVLCERGVLPSTHRDCPLLVEGACSEATRRAEEEMRERLEEDAAWVERVGIPLALREAVRRRPCLATPAIEAVNRWVESGALAGRALLLSGGVGAGKSWAAARAVWHWRCARRGGARWEQATDLLAAHRAARWPRGGAGDRWRDALLARLLIVDDLGVEDAGAPGASEALDQLVSRREADRSATIFTTNLALRGVEGGGESAFSARYGERAASRLRGWAVCVECGSEDLRRRQT